MLRKQTIRLIKYQIRKLLELKSAVNKPYAAFFKLSLKIQISHSITQALHFIPLWTMILNDGGILLPMEPYDHTDDLLTTQTE